MLYVFQRREGKHAKLEAKSSHALFQSEKLFRSTDDSIDLIRRDGGEEFAILLPETQREQAIEIAESLRTTAANTEITLGNHCALHLTISIGLATTTERGTRLEMLLIKADAAMYHAKQSGRNTVSIAQETDGDVAPLGWP